MSASISGPRGPCRGEVVVPKVCDSDPGWGASYAGGNSAHAGVRRAEGILKNSEECDAFTFSTATEVPKLTRGECELDERAPCDSWGGLTTK